MFKFLLNWFFPPHCMDCGCILSINSKRWICVECFEKLAFIREPVCYKCGKPICCDDDSLCLSCKPLEHVYTRGYSLLKYDKAIRSIIHKFKYYDRREYAATFGLLMADFIKDKLIADDIDLIVPVPMHSRKKRRRGYNQAELLAKELSLNLNIPFADILIRNKETVAQSLVSVDDRSSNIRGAISVKCSSAQNNRILIVDDIYTTGNTLNECSRVLLEANAKDVIVFTLAIVCSHKDALLMS